MAFIRTHFSKMTVSLGTGVTVCVFMASFLVCLECARIPDAQFAVVSYHQDGSLDEAFDGDGIVLTDLPFSSTEGAMAVHIASWFYDGSPDPDDRPEGNIVVAGDALVGDGNQFVVARYKEWDGSLETLFDGDGIVRTDFPSAQSESALDVIAVFDPLCIVVVGKAWVEEGHRFALARYYWSGSMDTGFDGDGLLITDFSSSSDEVARAVAVAEFDDEHKIVVAGDALIGDGRQFALARYLWNGRLDTSFDGDGKVLTNFTSAEWASGSDIALTTVEGEIKTVVAGSALIDGHYQFALARYNLNGSLDTSFDTDGKVLTDVVLSRSEYIYAMHVDDDGKIVVAGYAQVDEGEDRFVLARYNIDGSLDSSFGIDGIVLTEFPSSSSARAYDMDIDREGKILAGGSVLAGGGYCFAMARYNSDGSLDSSFDGDGRVITNITTTRNEIARGICNCYRHPSRTTLCLVGEAGR